MTILYEMGANIGITLQKANDVAERIKPAAKAAMEGFSAVGALLGSIFILIVVFYYVTSLLEGGKFQMKMLYPVALYILVLTFSSTVGNTILAFSGGLRRGLTEQAVKVQNSLSSGPDGAEDSFLITVLKKQGFSLDGTNPANETNRQIYEELYGDGEEPASSEVDTEKEKFSLVNMAKGFAASVLDSLQIWWTKLKVGMIESMYPNYSAKLAVGWAITFTNSIVFFILCSIIDYIIMVLAFVMVCWGIINMFILIAFGPITWSFAIFPGNGKILGSWFIRVAQYSLYGPVAMIIRTFIYAVGLQVCELNLLSGSGLFDYVTFLTIGICCILALMSVPTICSHILEGASGGVSMMQSLSTLMGGVNMVMNRRQLQKLDKIENTNNRQGSGGGRGSGSGRRGGII